MGCIVQPDTHAMQSARPRIAAMVATMHTNGFDTVCVMICYACEYVSALSTNSLDGHD